MTSMYPKVKILMSTFNGEKLLAEQLDSLMRQKNISVEIIIRDDGSTDKTVDIINKYREKCNIDVLVEKNIGVTKSFLRLIEYSELDADYYAFCDQDDVWLEKKLDVAVSAIKKYQNDNPVLYHSNVKRVGAELEEIVDVFMEKYYPNEFGAALIATEATGCTMVWNRKLMEYLKEYRPNYAFMHDNWTCLVCFAVGGNVHYDDKTYILYRQHSGNVVGKAKKIQQGRISLFIYRIMKLFDSSYQYERVSCELLKGYRQYMSEDNIRRCNMILNANHSLKERVRLLFGNLVRSPYFALNVKFGIQVIRRKL